MKTELKGRFEGLEFKRVLYRANSNPKQEFAKYLEAAKEIEREMEVKTRKFVPRQDKPEAILKSYGSSEVIVETACDNFLNWESSEVIRATVSDGAQAQRFLEYCLHNFGGDFGVSLRRNMPHSFEKIPFQCQESEGGRRTLNLIIGINHPQIMWREIFNIFIAQVNQNET